MRTEPLLAKEPPSAVRNVGELYAIALAQALQATQRYGKLAAAGDDAFEPVRCVFEALSQRERDRVDSIIGACIAAIGRAPDMADLRWTPSDLVPVQELSDIKDSLLSTVYGAWALAVRHRERAFVFWTYVVALAEADAVRAIGEELAREALHDGNLLRRERRLAWRAEQKGTLSEDSPVPTELSTAALLESLLLKDLLRWSQETAPPQRQHLLLLIGAGSEFSIPDTTDPAPQHSETLEEITRRALFRAERLSSIYLDEADNALDQSRLELAQQLASRSIARLADLRAIASARG